MAIFYSDSGSFRDLLVSGSTTLSGALYLPVIENSNRPNILSIDITSGQLYYASTSSISNAISAISSSYPIAVTGSTIYSTGPLSTATPNVTNNIFLGASAGALAPTASYSTLIGYKAGYITASTASPTSSIWSNNIVIGTNITLPPSYSNAINIGGILFGSGAYSTITDTTTSSFSGSANGRIGINVVNPLTTLHVSGTIEFDGIANTNQANFLAYNSTSGLVTYASTSSINAATASNVQGGRSRYMALWFGSTQLTSSATIYEDVNGRIGIGITSPLVALQISRSGQIYLPVGASDFTQAGLLLGGLYDISSWTASNGGEAKISAANGNGVGPGGINGDLILATRYSVNNQSIRFLYSGSTYTSSINPYTFYGTVASFTSSLNISGAINLSGSLTLNGIANTNQANFLAYNTNGTVTYTATSSFTASWAVSASQAITASFALNAPNATNAASSSYPIAATGSTIYSTGPLSTTAPNTNNSIFLGASAGALAPTASYSTLIGYKAGYITASAASPTSSIWSNNIIIGTNITLPPSYSNAINIGGILFGSGSYSTITDTATSSFSGSAGGRIGINVVNPSATLHVSGTLEFDGIANANQAYVLTYNSASGVVTYFSTASIAASSSRYPINADGAGIDNNIWSTGPYSALTDGTTNTSRSIAIGYYAGAYTTTTGSVSIGWYAGYFDKGGTYNNVSIGHEAGKYADLKNSIMIGTSAGKYSGTHVFNADNLILIGTQVASGSTLGPNNMVIGTNITLPYTASNSINIGGLIFGSGSYADTTTAPFSGSAGGKIGINEPSPTYNFQVSGTVAFPNLGIGATTNNIVLLGSNGQLFYTSSTWVGTTTTATNAISSSYPISVTGSTIYSTGPLSTATPNPTNSIFLGASAGALAPTASYSTLIGYKAGYITASTASPTSSIWSNNIIIGTNITLPPSYSNAINIGGILFGSGSYSTVTDTATSSFSGSANGRIGINIVNPLATLHVVGTTQLAGNTTITGSLIASSSLHTLIGNGSIIGSGSKILNVSGSTGTLLQVNDINSGSLFSVNNTIGQPILETFSDGTTLIGNYPYRALNTTNRILAVSGTNTLYSVPTASYDALFVDYVVKSGSNMRSGHIRAHWLSSTIVKSEITNTSIGTTTAISITPILTGSNTVLNASSSAGIWDVKAIIRGI